jgi:hypothetical protein
MATNSNTRPAAARAFVRSLNILLKFARMYDFGHPRTVKQFETGWSELRTALGSGSENEAGVLLGVSGDQLLLDGTPLESAAAEKSFAKMLSSAGIASIHFSPKVTQASLARFVRAFPTGTGAKPVQLAEQLKTALQGDPHIHVNEVCFVPADSAVAKSTIAAQLAARTLGLNSEKSDELFNDPERLLQLIIAAEGTKGSGSGPRAGGLGGDGSGDGNGGSGSGGDGSGGSGGSGSGNGGGSGDGNGGGSGNGFEGSGSGRGGGFESRGGDGRGTGGHGGGPGYYAGDSSEIIRGIPAGDGEPGADGVRMSGPVSSVGGSEGGTEQRRIVRPRNVEYCRRRWRWSSFGTGRRRLLVQQRQFEAFVKRGTRVGNAHQRWSSCSRIKFRERKPLKRLRQLEYCWRQRRGRSS